MTTCSHPETSRRSWAVIPNLQLDWCSTCGAIQFADKPWKIPELAVGRLTEQEEQPGQSTVYVERVHPAGETFDETIARQTGMARFRSPELERQRTINVDIHQPQPTMYSKTGSARCGNCGTRYDITSDPEENHHRAMRHKLTCGKTAVDQYTEEQRDTLKREFDEQPHIQAQTLKWLSSEVDRARQLLAGPPIPPPPLVPTCPRCGHSHIFKCGCGCQVIVHQVTGPELERNIRAIEAGADPSAQAKERPWWKLW